MPKTLSACQLPQKLPKGATPLVLRRARENKGIRIVGKQCLCGKIVTLWFQHFECSKPTHANEYRPHTAQSRIPPPPPVSFCLCFGDCCRNPDSPAQLRRWETFRRGLIRRSDLRSRKSLRNSPDPIERCLSGFQGSNPPYLHIVLS